MSQEALFPGSEATPQPDSQPPTGGRPRFQAPVRNQGEWAQTELDGLLEDDHRARIVWAYVQSLDLRPFYDLIRAVETGVGRPPIDPAILMTLWLYATAEGVGSARALAKLCVSHNAYRWICGGVSVNYHTLSDFRTAHGERLDVVLTQSVATLMNEGVVSLERVAQDGVKVRASAGASSYRGKEGLEECLRQAKTQVEALKQELTQDPGATTARQAAAKTRAVREREERVQRAIAVREELEQQRTKKVNPKKDEDSPSGLVVKQEPASGGETKQEPVSEAVAQEKHEQKEEEAPKKGEKKQLRVSTTDSDARVMKMPDGGYRPAFNAQLATDTKSQIIVGVEVDNCGNDFRQLDPMLDQVKARYGKPVLEALVDGGYVSTPEIDAVTEKGTVLYAPTRVQKTTKNPEIANPHLPRADDSKAVGDWRVRMGTPEAKEIYKERASTAECVNALARNRGLRQYYVRGIAKVRSVMLWFALTHNLLRAASLRAAARAVA